MATLGTPVSLSVSWSGLTQETEEGWTRPGVRRDTKGKVGSRDPLPSTRKTSWNTQSLGPGHTSTLLRRQ